MNRASNRASASYSFGAVGTVAVGAVDAVDAVGAVDAAVALADLHSKLDKGFGKMP